MKIKYMGTAAFEAIPAIFCQCDICIRAKKNKGKDIRGRAGVVIDEQLLIDFPPDIYMHSLNHNIDLSKIKDILITHTHSDHFASDELMKRMPNTYCYINDGEQFVNLYGNKRTNEILKSSLKLEFGSDDDVDFIRYNEMKEFEVKKISQYNVTPLLANHMPTEKAFIYIMEKDNKSFLYAHDTGIFREETFKFLNDKQIQFDCISFDCTTALKRCNFSHMGVPDILEVKEKLHSQGNLKPNTKYILSHFSHNGGSLHQEIVEAVKGYNFIVAYDGMEIEI